MNDTSDKNSSTSAKDAFSSGKSVKAAGKTANKASKSTKKVMFLPEELDLYCNKVTLESFVFHGKEVDYEALDYMEYDHEAHTVDVFMKDGSVLDLGVEIQWLLRPYFSKSNEIQIVQTKDREAINGTFLPLMHKNAKSV